MVKKKSVRMWVDPDFKHMMKLEATRKNVALLDFTRELASCDDPFVEITNKKKRRGGGGVFDLGF